MFDFNLPVSGSIKKEIDTFTVSQCCDAPVSVMTPDDFSKINKDDRETWIMTVEFICNKCGEVCTVKEIPIDDRG